MSKPKTLAALLEKLGHMRMIASAADDGVQYRRMLKKMGKKVPGADVKDALKMRQKAGRKIAEIERTVNPPKPSVHTKINERVMFKRIGGRVIPIRRK